MSGNQGPSATASAARATSPNLSSGGIRTHADVSSLLVELSRLMKALSLYGANSAQRRSLHERTFLAWQADLDRSGPLELQVGSSSFAVHGVDASIEFSHIFNLACALTDRRIERLRFASPLQRESFRDFAELLAGSATLAGGALPDPSNWTLSEDGFEIPSKNEATAGAAAESAEVAARELAPTAPAPTPHPAATRSPAPPDASVYAAPEVMADAAVTEAWPGEAESEEPQWAKPFWNPPAPDRATEAERVQKREPTPPPAALSQLLRPATPVTISAPVDSTCDFERDAQEFAEKPSIDEEPLAAPAVDRRAEQLNKWLRELDDCEKDSAYTAMAGDITLEAIKLSREGYAQDSHRACVVLADHAVGEGGRSGFQAQRAQEALIEVATRATLPDLISRACDVDDGYGVRAARILLQLGEAAAPAVFDALCRENDRQQLAQLNGLMIALGERGRTVLESNMLRPACTRARQAIRIAGEIQSQVFVPTLASILSGSDAGMRKEAAKALLLIGGPMAVNALVVALSSPLEKLSEIAAYCLGELRDRRAVAPLLRSLESNVTNGQLEIAREQVRALGRIGSEEAVPRLRAILYERGLTKRRKRRELKLASVAALGKIPGPEARRALVEAGRDGEAQVREKAKQLLTPAAK